MTETDKRQDGGPAFPTLTPDYSKNGYPIPREADGMSLRDWFAGQALIGYLTNPNYEDSADANFAKWSYATADALIAEREKNDG